MSIVLDGTSGLTSPAATLTTTPLPVTSGGTGVALTTAYGVLAGGTTTTGALQNIGAGTAAQVLTSNGASALPTFQTPASGGVTTIGFGTTGLTPSAATGGVVTVAGTLAVANGGTGNATGTAANLYGPGGNYISSSTSGTAYSTGMQVREKLLAGAQGYAMTAAPMLAWHWSGVVASSMMLEASGRIGIYNNPGTAYEAFACGDLTSSGTVTGTSFSGAAGIGVGQTWQAVSRAKGTVYTNSTGKPIMVFITMQNTSNSTSTIQIDGGVTRGQFNNYGSYGGGTFIVPNGATYSYNGPPNLNQWSELR